MGSSAITSSLASDNRQAITDEALGLSASGIGSNASLYGHILNFGTSSAGKNSDNDLNMKQGGSGSGGNPQSSYGSGLSVNILDGQAINKAFDFAAFSLSETLGSILNGNKQTAEQLAAAQTYSMDTIGQAINSAATTTSQAAQQAATENSETIKKFAMIGTAGFAAWYFLFKGKK